MPVFVAVDARRRVMNASTTISAGEHLPSQTQWKGLLVRTVAGPRRPAVEGIGTPLFDDTRAGGGNPRRNSSTNKRDGRSKALSVREPHVRTVREPGLSSGLSREMEAVNRD